MDPASNLPAGMRWDGILYTALGCSMLPRARPQRTPAEMDGVVDSAVAAAGVGYGVVTLEA